jgi:hypothetical protein
VYTIRKISKKEGMSPLEKLFDPKGEMSGMHSMWEQHLGAGMLDGTGAPMLK